MGVDDSDITVESARRCTLMLAGVFLLEPISHGSRAVSARTQYEGIKPGSCIDLQPNALPGPVAARLRERLLGAPGELVSGDRCAWPCSCIPDYERTEAAGQGESTLTLLIDYEEKMAEGSSHRGDRGANEPPPVNQILGDDGKPVPFDPETDSLDMYSLTGPHGSWQTWHVMRRYRVTLSVKLRYQATRVPGTCLDLSEFV
jgi:hypothetical protein